MWAGVGRALSERAARGGPPPLGFSQVFILKTLKVVCFQTLLQVLILNVVSQGQCGAVWRLAFRRRRFAIL
jgi:hypothetical protein